MPSARAHLDSAFKIFHTPSASRIPHHTIAATTPKAFQSIIVTVGSNKTIGNLVIV